MVVDTYRCFTLKARLLRPTYDNMCHPTTFTNTALDDTCLSYWLASRDAVGTYEAKRQCETMAQLIHVTQEPAAGQSESYWHG